MDSMFNAPFHYRMKSRRSELGLSQTEAAQQCGLSNKRWSQLERGYRFPGSFEERRIRKYLNIRDYLLPPKAVVKRLSVEGSKLELSPTPYFPPQDRPTFYRYFAAKKRQPKLVQKLTSLVEQRSDIATCAFFCERTRCDSYLEALHILYLLALGAVPCLKTPALLGHPPAALVDPRSKKEVGHRKHLCLALGHQRLFFQMGLATTQMLVVDVLSWNGEWRVIELDGAGHDSSLDTARDQLLGIPVQRVLAYELEQEIRGFLRL